MNFQNLYDYGLTGDNIQVWPTEASAPITIEAADFFAWLANKSYVVDYCLRQPYTNSVCVDTDVESRTRYWQTWEEWWADARVISQPGKFDGKRDLLDQLLCEYLNDPANERFTDCRTVADLPTEFLTTAEKAGKN